MELGHLDATNFATVIMRVDHGLLLGHIAKRAELWLSFKPWHKRTKELPPTGADSVHAAELAGSP